METSKSDGQLWDRSKKVSAIPRICSTPNVETMSECDLQSQLSQDETSSKDSNVSINLTGCKGVAIAGSSLKINEYTQDGSMQSIPFLNQEKQALIDQTAWLIECHNRNWTYMRTKVFHKAQEMLDNRHVAVLKGNPGDGKTSLGLELLNHFSSGSESSLHGDISTSVVPMNIKHESEWRKFVDKKQKAIVFIDDIFGKNLDNQNVKSWENVFDVIYAAAETQNVYTIIGIRSCIYKEQKEALTRGP